MSLRGGGGASSPGGSGVSSVTAGDSSIVVGGTGSAPTLETATLDVIATDHPPAANWSNNSHKITSVADPASAQDAATKNYVDTHGGGSSPTAAQPLLVTASPYNAKCDAKIVTDAAITSGTNLLSSTQAAYTNANVGQVVIVNDAGGSNQPLVGWITSVAAGVATLMTTKGGATPANAGATVSAVIAIYGTDDTAAYQALITDLYAGDGAYGRIPGLSMIAGPLLNAKRDGPTNSFVYNAQLPLPAVQQGAFQKRLIRLVGDYPNGSIFAGAAADNFFKLSGLVTTLTGSVYDATNGWPCLIGGPKGTTSACNIDLHLENLTFISPEDPSVGQVYAQTLSTATVEKCSFWSSALIAINNQPSHLTGFGLWMPGLNCEVGSRVEDVVFAGLYCGLIPGEHTAMTNVDIVYCTLGIGLQQMSHFASGLYVAIEGCTYAIAGYSSASGAVAAASAARLDISCLDLECTGAAGWNTQLQTVWDAGGNIKGRIGYYVNLGVTVFTGVTGLLATQIAALGYSAITAGTNMSAAAASGFVAAQASLDDSGNVQLAGILTATGAVAAGAVIGTLPSALQPGHAKEIPVVCNGTRDATTTGWILYISTNQIQLYGGTLASTNTVILDGVHFNRL